MNSKWVHTYILPTLGEPCAIDIYTAIEQDMSLLSCLGPQANGQEIHI